MRGVINLRGNVVPVVDMRLKFGMTKTEQTVNTCIIIVEISLDGDTTVLGALADSVQEVIDLEPDKIEPAPKIGTRLKTDFIKGMGNRNEQFVIILDIDKVFSVDELSLVRTRGNRQANRFGIINNV
jgi:purine-binding chemotaxis protein CheW